MISIRKYLYAEGGKGVDRAWLDSQYALCSGLFEEVGRNVLGEQEALRTQWEELQAGLRPDLDAEAADRMGRAASRILAGHKAVAQQGATANAVEMRHILGMLNQALVALEGGSGRSQERLQKIEESLRRASGLSSIVAMRSCLAETIRYVEQAAEQENEGATRERATLAEEASQARAALGRSFRGLAGRPEGVQRIREAVQTVPPEQALYLVAYLLERLPAIVNRYGNGIAEELMLRLIKERLQPLAAGNAAYRWTDASLVGVFYRPKNLASLRDELAILNRAPLVHAVALGHRTATLTLSPSHLVAEGEGNAPEPLIAEADRFTGSYATE